jgi:hypothetical protein
MTTMNLSLWLCLFWTFLINRIIYQIVHTFVASFAELTVFKAHPLYGYAIFYLSSIESPFWLL